MCANVTKHIVTLTKHCCPKCVPTLQSMLLPLRSIVAQNLCQRYETYCYPYEALFPKTCATVTKHIVTLTKHCCPKCVPTLRSILLYLRSIVAKNVCQRYEAYCHLYETLSLKMCANVTKHIVTLTKHCRPKCVPPLRSILLPLRSIVTLTKHGITASQLDLQSLTPLSVAGCGRLKLGAADWSTPVALPQVVDNN